MSKGAYSVVSYPDSSDINDILVRLRAAGASCMWILHDKDKDENGKEKKCHWHIACGWETGFPTWKKFLEFKKVLDVECFKGDSEKGSVFGKMIPDKCLVHDAEILELYFLHADEKSIAEGKHRYNDDELFKDDDWLGAVYNSADFRRTKKRKADSDENAQELTDIFSILRDHGFKDWFELIDFVCATCPDKMATVSKNAYCIKSYLDSVRCSHAYKSKLESEIARLSIELIEAKRDAQEYKDLYLQYLAFYEQYMLNNGESAVSTDIP